MTEVPLLTFISISDDKNQNRISKLFAQYVGCSIDNACGFEVEIAFTESLVSKKEEHKDEYVYELKRATEEQRALIHNAIITLWFEWQADVLNSKRFDVTN